MEWDDDSRREQAALLRWLADKYERGTLTVDMHPPPGRVWAAGAVGEFSAWQLVRQITNLVGFAEIIRDGEEG